MMEPVSPETVRAAVEILGVCERVDAHVEKRIRALVADDLTVFRLVHVIPEAFGLVLIAHMPEAKTVTLPATFSVQDTTGQRRVFPLRCEPVFIEAINIAEHVFHNGPRHIFKTNADRSSVIDAINKTLNSHGPSAMKDSAINICFHGVPSSLYSQYSQS